MPQVNMVDRPEASYDYSFYTIIPDGWEYDQTINSKKYPYIVDSGTTLNYLPPSTSYFSLLQSLPIFRTIMPSFFSSATLLFHALQAQK
jgi:hypothetical protein